MQDFYSILGVPVDATHGQIVQAHQELAKRYHPDRLQDNPLKHLAEEKLKEINNAFDTLGNPERRAKYDAQRSVLSEAEQVDYQQHPRRVCHRHPNSPAVAVCQFCSRNMCQSCASQFTILSCPECLRQNNAVYLRKVKVAVWTPVIIFLAASLIAFILITHSAEALVIGLYALGLYWGWDFFKNNVWTAGVGCIVDLPIGVLILLVLLAVGWIVGLISGGFKYIKLLLHYRETLRVYTEAEQYINQYAPSV